MRMCLALIILSVVTAACSERSEVDRDDQRSNAEAGSSDSTSSHSESRAEWQERLSTTEDGASVVDREPMIAATQAVHEDVEGASLRESETQSKLRELGKDPAWHKGWDSLVLNDGIAFEKLPWFETPASIKATKMKNPKPVKLTDYWIRDTGYTTMYGHALQNYTNKNYRSDGVRWDTPTSWVPKRADGSSSGGNLTLMTQFGADVPNYWSGATPRGAQTDWIFHVDYKTGAIMEIFDRQHFRFRNGKIEPAFSELTAKSYWESLYWGPSHAYPIGGKWAFEGPADFRGNNGERFLGYTSVSVVNRYETFTVPPSRNKSRDCPATEFKDVIALRHHQWWYDASTKTSRGDYLVLYMAKNVGWIYMILNDSTSYDQSNAPTKDAKHVLHLSPVGYIKQSGNWDRLCPHQFRDMMVNGK